MSIKFPEKTLNADLLKFGNTFQINLVRIANYDNDVEWMICNHTVQLSLNANQSYSLPLKTIIKLEAVIWFCCQVKITNKPAIKSMHGPMHIWRENDNKPN